MRRRVYDAFNVLMAVGVIEKDKAARKVVWKGMLKKGPAEIDLLQVNMGLEALAGS